MCTNPQVVAQYRELSAKVVQLEGEVAAHAAQLQAIGQEIAQLKVRACVDNRTSLMQLINAYFADDAAVEQRNLWLLMIGFTCRRSVDCPKGSCERPTCFPSLIYIAQ